MMKEKININNTEDVAPKWFFDILKRSGTLDDLEKDQKNYKKVNIMKFSKKNIGTYYSY